MGIFGWLNGGGPKISLIELVKRYSFEQVGGIPLLEQERLAGILEQIEQGSFLRWSQKAPKEHQTQVVEWANSILQVCSNNLPAGDTCYSISELPVSKRALELALLILMFWTAAQKKMTDFEAMKIVYLGLADYHDIPVEEAARLRSVFSAEKMKSVVATYNEGGANKGQPLMNYASELVLVGKLKERVDQLQRAELARLLQQMKTFYAA